jgi:ribosomal protein S18 acetylase RimI-like enzyme
MVNFQIRNVIEADFIQISHIAEKCKPMTIMNNSTYHIFTKHFKNTSFVVEDIDGNLIGFLLGFISQNNPKEGYIHLLCIDLKLRREGIAKNLVKNFIKTVSDKGCKKVVLVTKPQNKISIKFYNKMGFIPYKSNQIVQIEDMDVFKDYDGPGEDKIVLFKLI